MEMHLKIAFLEPGGMLQYFGARLNGSGVYYCRFPRYLTKSYHTTAVAVNHAYIDLYSCVYVYIY